MTATLLQPLKRVAGAFWKAWLGSQDSPPLLPHNDTGPGLETLVAEDGPTRLCILGIVSGAEAVSLAFIAAAVQGSPEERQRSLDWLETHGLIQKRWSRQQVGFWGHWETALCYAPTPTGEYLLHLALATRQKENTGS